MSLKCKGTSKQINAITRNKGKRVKVRIIGCSRTEMINEVVHFRDIVKNRRGGKAIRKRVIRKQMEKEI